MQQSGVSIMAAGKFKRLTCREKISSHLLLAVKLAARETPASLFFSPVGESMLQVL